MSQDRFEDRFEQPKEKVQHGNEGVANEVNDGREDLVASQKQKAEDLRAGASSGITGQFGKPLIFDDGDQRGQACPEQNHFGDEEAPHMTPIPWSIQDVRRRERQPDKYDTLEPYRQTFDKEDYLAQNGFTPHVQVLRPDPTANHRRRQ